MKKKDFWERVKRGTEELEIPNTTFRKWKSRGRVSREQAIPIYQVLAGTEYEIPLDRLQ